VLVIGGGIYGAWSAYDAALRGLKVALIEKNDWGSGTSQSSSKLIHGGLRYLEHYEFALVRHSLAERRVLSQLAPHLVRPLNFMVPVWKGARAGRMKLMAGLTLYDLLATGEQPVPRFKSFSRRKLLEAHPYLAAAGLTGGLRYGDCQEDDARMTLFVVAAAQEAGAVCVNRIAAESLLTEGGRCIGAELHDVQTGERFTAKAKCVVNAGGPWASALAGEEAPPVELIKGAHLVMPAIPGLEAAFLLTAPQDGRVFFVIPWNGRTLVGTTESAVKTAAEAVVNEPDVRYLLGAVNALMPGLGWTRDQVLGSFAGVRTLQADQAGSLSAVSREFVVTVPRPGLVMPIGGKYTTARCDAVDIVDRVQDELDQPRSASRTSAHSLPGAPHASATPEAFGYWQIETIAALGSRGLAPDIARSLTLRHGTRIDRIVALLGENPGWAARLHFEAPYIEAEVVLAAREEMALSVEDVIRRRMPLALMVKPDTAMDVRVGELIASA
jgi:glycerol-3-phosphate dehydrogenase